MRQDWAPCQRRIHYERRRYERLKDIASHYSTQAGADVQSAFRAIEEVLPELLTVQKKYMLHLRPSELNPPFIRFLLKWRFNIWGKAKLNALLQELQGYNDTIERTLALCYHSSSRRQDSLRAPHMEHHVHDAIAASNWREDGHSAASVVLPLTLVSKPTPSHHPTTKAHFPNYSSRSSHQASPTVGRPASILYTRASSPTPSHATNIGSWFRSTETFFSEERDDNCSGPLHREYSSSSSQG